MAVALILSLVVVAAPAFCLGMGVRGTRHAPLAARVAAILKMPVGKNGYLEPLQKLLRVIHPMLWHSTAASIEGRLARNHAFRQNLSSLVAAFRKGASPIALRDAVVGHLTLDGQYVSGKDLRWRLGGLWDRVVLCSYLRHLARRACVAGQRSRSAAYARTSIMLWAQDSVELGGGASLGDWLNPKVFPKAAMNLRSLSLSAKQKRLLTGLFRRSAATRLRFETVRNNPLMRYALVLQKSGAKTIPKESLNGFLSAVQSCPPLRRCQVGLGRYALMVVSTVHREFAEDGHAGAARKLEKVLAGVAGRLRRLKQPAAVDRNALLRWIKEAMGP